MLKNSDREKQGKGKGKLFEDMATGRFKKVANEEEYEGAFKTGTHVRAQMKDGSWVIARIVEVKKVQQEGQDGQASPTKQPKQQKFKYYVNYIDYNRRMDRWVTEEQVREDRENIQKELDQRKEEQKKLEEQMPGFLVNDEHNGLDEKQIEEHEQATKLKTIEYVQIGKYKVETWYFSPFPEEYQDIECLYVCEYCLYFFVAEAELVRHTEKCKARHPPGDEIYRDDKVAMWELDGKRNQIYCENLSYISKLFLDHKTLQYDLDPFHFYVLTEYDDLGYHFMGYFSKEKGPTENNLSCILVMPYCQRGGYGKFLIEFSYELSIKEGRAGTPERPLSDLGFRSYLSYWTIKILGVLMEPSEQQLSIQEISNKTGILTKDIIYVLENYDILRYY